MFAYQNQMCILTHSTHQFVVVASITTIENKNGCSSYVTNEHMGTSMLFTDDQRTTGKENIRETKCKWIDENIKQWGLKHSMNEHRGGRNEINHELKQKKLFNFSC
jgi:hypothetical protein